MNPHLPTALAVAVLLLFQSAASAASYCQRDPVTSVSVPNGGKGVCIQDSAAAREFLHYTEEGILIAQMPAPDSGSSRTRQTLDSTGDEAGLLYCPAGLLHVETGAPTVECLGADGSPGPDAFVGSGRIQASASMGEFGSPVCPSSIHVRGIVNSPGGEAFQIQSSLVQFRDSATETECETVWQEISTNYLGRASTLPGPGFSQLGLTQERIASGRELPEVDPADLALLERISNLDDTQFELLIRLTKIQPAEWPTLTQYLDTEGRVHIAKDGTLGPPRAALTTGPSPVNFTIDDIYNLLTNITYRGATREFLGETFLAIGKVDDFFAKRLDFIDGRLQGVQEAFVDRSKMLFDGTGSLLLDAAEGVPEFLTLVRGTFNVFKPVASRPPRRLAALRAPTARSSNRKSRTCPASSGNCKACTPGFPT